MKNQSQHDQDLELIESIDVDSGLTDWEADFVDSCLDRLKLHFDGRLTDKQREVAQRIQAKLDGA